MYEFVFADAMDGITPYPVLNLTLGLSGSVSIHTIPALLCCVVLRYGVREVACCFLDPITIPHCRLFIYCISSFHFPPLRFLSFSTLSPIFPQYTEQWWNLFKWYITVKKRGEEKNQRRRILYGRWIELNLIGICRGTTILCRLYASQQLISFDMVTICSF